MDNLKNYNNIIGERLVILEQILDIKPVEMAGIGGCSQATYYRYRKGESEPTISFLNEILQNEKRISAKWLLTGMGPVLSGADDADPVYENQFEIEQLEFVNLPLYNMENQDGGEGELSIEQWNNTSYNLPLCNMFIEEIVEEDTEKLFALFIECNAMAPEITSGSLVLVDRGKTDISVDGIFVVKFDDVIRLKLIQRLPDKKVRLSTFNKKYDPIELKLDQYEDFKVLGRIVWVGTPY